MWESTTLNCIINRHLVCSTKQNEIYYGKEFSTLIENALPFLNFDHALSCRPYSP